MDYMSQLDKSFWHGYLDFYEPFFNKKFSNIAEIGVNHGHSIRWLLDRFPDAQIYGADIIDRLEMWPEDPRFTFKRFDQGNVPSLTDFFSLADFDLIIEDGSHHPDHQALALVKGIQALKPGGTYILEDIHTSHPVYIQRTKRLFDKFKTPKGTALSVLLGIAHYQKIGESINRDRAELIAKNSILSVEDVLILVNNLAQIHFYRRDHLPEKCFKCGSIDYDFSTYRCQCGQRIFSDWDSMSFVLIKK